jgi:hypothetical protein
VNVGLVLLDCMHGLVRDDLVVSLDNVRNEEVAFLDIVFGSYLDFEEGVEGRKEGNRYREGSVYQFIGKGRCDAGAVVRPTVCSYTPGMPWE